MGRGEDDRSIDGETRGEEQAPRPSASILCDCTIGWLRAMGRPSTASCAALPAKQPFPPAAYRSIARAKQHRSTNFPSQLTLLTNLTRPTH